MPNLDMSYTHGVIAAREKYLLKDKIMRLCELSAEDAFRFLIESGFGGVENATNVHEYENLIAAEERALDAFIKEYAPSEAERIFLLAPRDFHNAKALVKASYLHVDASYMLAPQGFISIEQLTQAIENGKFESLKGKNAVLAETCKAAWASLEENPSGAKVGEIFEKALYSYLSAQTKKNAVLKKLLAAKVDMTNILTAFRCGEKTLAKEKYLPGGGLSCEQLNVLFAEDNEKIRRAFSGTAYVDFIKLCLEGKERGEPMIAAEKYADGYETEFFAKRKFDLIKSEPFLYYVYRRRTENANVRIVFACLLAGQSEQEIKKRLRAF